MVFKSHTRFRKKQNREIAVRAIDLEFSHTGAARLVASTVCDSADARMDAWMRRKAVRGTLPVWQRPIYSTTQVERWERKAQQRRQA